MQERLLEAYCDITALATLCVIFFKETIALFLFVCFLCIHSHEIPLVKYVQAHRSSVLRNSEYCRAPLRFLLAMIKSNRETSKNRTCAAGQRSSPPSARGPPGRRG